jgi:hypothetical protein
MSMFLKLVLNDDDPILPLSASPGAQLAGNEQQIKEGLASMQQQARPDEIFIPNTSANSPKTSFQVFASREKQSESHRAQKKADSKKRSNQRTSKSTTRYLSAMDHCIPAEPRHRISSEGDSIFQASEDCWDDILPVPQNSSQEEDRDDAKWLPFLERLGLQPGTYPSIDVEDKVCRPGKPGGGPKNLNPNWTFMAYTLIALSPKGKLTSREIYHLSLAWCSTLPANNASCRHALTGMSKVKKGRNTTLVLDDLGCYRLRNIVDSTSFTTSSRSSANSPKSPSLANAPSSPFSESYPSASSSVTSTKELEQPKVSGDADGERQTKSLGGKKRKRSDSATGESTTKVHDNAGPGAQDEARRKRPSKYFESSNKAQPKSTGTQAPQKSDLQDAIVPAPSGQIPRNAMRVEHMQSKTTNKFSAKGGMNASTDIDAAATERREQIERLCYTERFIDRCAQDGRGRCQDTFGTDQHPLEILERVRYSLNCALQEGGVLLNIPALAAYQARSAPGACLPNGRTLLPSK